MQAVHLALVLAGSLAGCGSAHVATETSGARAPTTEPEASKRADAVLVELDVRGADDTAVENLRTEIRRSSSLSLDPASVGDGARKLLLRFEATEPTQSGAALERTMTLTGFTTGGECQIFKLSPKLTKPGGKKESAADVDELTSAGVKNMVGTIEGLAPRIGPNATCVATGR